MITENIPPTAWFSNVCRKNGVSVSQGQLEQIKHYVNLLLQWNKRVNLISRKDEENVWQNHILHCASLLFKLRFPKGATLVDIGTGAGLPGIPLKILQPDLQVSLIDATQKKINAVQSILSEIKLTGVTAHWGRSEELSKKPDFKSVFDVVVARAVAPLPDLVKWGVPLLKKSARAQLDASVENLEKVTIAPPALVAMKGGELNQEITRIRMHGAVREVRVVDLVFAGSEQVSLSDKKVVVIYF